MANIGKSAFYGCEKMSFLNRRILKERGIGCRGLFESWGCQCDDARDFGPDHDSHEP